MSVWMYKEGSYTYKNTPIDQVRGYSILPGAFSPVSLGFNNRTCLIHKMMALAVAFAIALIGPAGAPPRNPRLVLRTEILGTFLLPIKTDMSKGVESSVAVDAGQIASSASQLSVASEVALPTINTRLP